VCAVPLFPLVPLLSRGRAVLLNVRGGNNYVIYRAQNFSATVFPDQRATGAGIPCCDWACRERPSTGREYTGFLAIHGCALCIWPLRYAQHVACAVTMRRRALGALTLGQRPPLGIKGSPRERPVPLVRSPVLAHSLAQHPPTGLPGGEALGRLEASPGRRGARRWRRSHRQPVNRDWRAVWKKRSTDRRCSG